MSDDDAYAMELITTIPATGYTLRWFRRPWRGEEADIGDSEPVIGFMVFKRRSAKWFDGETEHTAVAPVTLAGVCDRGGCALVRPDGKIEVFDEGIFEGFDDFKRWVFEKPKAAAAR